MMNELSLREIQQEINKWGLQQFGYENRSHYEGDIACGTPMGSIIQLCGAFTEVAEIMRPVIEMHQGRWNKGMTTYERENALRAALEDGAADLLIWLCHWAGLNHIDLQEVLNRVWHERVQHRTQKDWEKIKAEEVERPVENVSQERVPGILGFNADTYRHSCCEAMKPDLESGCPFDEDIPRPSQGTDIPSIGAKFVAEATRRTDRLSQATICPECKTPSSDRAPKFCPECGFHLHRLDRG